MDLNKNLSVWVTLLGTLSFVGCAKDPLTDNSPQSNLGEFQEKMTHMNTHAILGKDFITFTLYRK